MDRKKREQVFMEHPAITGIQFALLKDITMIVSDGAQGLRLYAAVRTLALRNRISDRSVQYALRTFEKHGILTTVRVGGGLQTNEWLLKFLEEPCRVCAEMDATGASGETQQVHAGGATTAAIKDLHITEDKEKERNEMDGVPAPASARESSGGDTSGDTPDDDPHGSFSPDASLTPAPARKPLSDEDVADLLLLHSTGFLVAAGCVYWGRNFAEEMKVSEAQGVRVWEKLCTDGRLEKVVNCQKHNGRPPCYRLSRSELGLGPDEQPAYNPAMGTRAPAREALSDEDVADLLLLHAETYIVAAGCVYWGRNFAEKLNISETQGSRAWDQLCRDGRLEKVVNCQKHNGRLPCYRLWWPELGAGQDEQPAYNPAMGTSRSMSGAEYPAEQKARRERESQEKREPLNPPRSETMTHWMPFSGQ